MSACQECGAPTQLDFPLCKTCWQQRKASTGTALKAPAGRPALGESSPLDVECLYATCGAQPGTPCLIEQIPDWSTIRVVGLGTWRVEVHEARFRSWRSPKIALS